MSLDGPSRRIIAEPLEDPAPAEPTETPAPEAPRPAPEPAPAPR